MYCAMYCVMYVLTTGGLLLFESVLRCAQLRSDSIKLCSKLCCSSVE
jgi:hypothetical protein